MLPINYKKFLLLISCGSVLEYYDFAIFIYLAPMIGQSLIPIDNPNTNLIVSYAIFAIGGMSRVIGGMLFGHIGDTIGRKYTFVYTILLMAIPTTLIAFIPNWHIIGIWATILLLCGRIIQGLAIGGEVPGSVVFGYEISPKRYKALGSAVVIMGTNIGFVVASLICTQITKVHLGKFANWRIAFIIGGLFGIISYMLRRSLVETPIFVKYKELIARETVPIRVLWNGYKRELWQLIAIGGMLSSMLAVFTFYMPIYLHTFYAFPLNKLMQFNSYTIIVFILGSVIAGIMPRYFGKTFFILFAIIFSISGLILFNMYASMTLTHIFIAHIILLLFLGIICGRLPVLCAAFFPVSVRYTGVALAYNISFGIIAGSTQMVLTWLIKVTHIIWMPALYMSVFAIIFLFIALTISKQQMIEMNN